MQIYHTVISLYNLWRFCEVHTFLVHTEDSLSYLCSFRPHGVCVSVFFCVCACVCVLEGEYFYLDIFNVISRYTTFEMKPTNTFIQSKLCVLTEVLKCKVRLKLLVDYVFRKHYAIDLLGSS